MRNILSKIYNTILSTRAAGMYMLIFAIAIGVGTFIENDYGTSSAQEMIFRSRWFEILLILFSATIVANIVRFRMVKQKKWAALSLHSAIIIIILGAGVTRYFGYEGIMNIREGESANSFLSSDTYMKFAVVSDGKTYSFDEPTHFATLGSNKFDYSYHIGSKLFKVKLKEFIPNPVEEMVDDADGIPTIKVVVAGLHGRDEHYVSQGKRVDINGFNFNFTDDILPNSINVIYRNDSLQFATDAPISQMVMATQKLDTIQGGSYQELRLRSMYSRGESGFVIGDFKPKAKVSIQSASPKIKNESGVGLVMEVTLDGVTKEVMITGQKGQVGEAGVLDFENSKMAIIYGSKYIQLPFSIQLRDFIMDRYPGTDNPSSYASEVTVIDKPNNTNMNFRIFMNNILDYGGYRFFQSSFDKDEKGTYLSVNHDFWGTWISYIGYIILTLGMALTFFSKNSRFTSLVNKLDQHHSKIWLLLIFSTLEFTNISAQNGTPSGEINPEHANQFGHLLVQDYNGRFKPVNTLSSEILRKVSKTDVINGQSSDQVILSMMNFPEKWENIPLIHIGSHPEISKILQTNEKLVSYAQFFGSDGKYLFRDQIRAAQSTNPKDQGTFEKAIIKLDEKINIVSMVFSSRIMKIYPMANDPTNTWISPMEFQDLPMKSPELTNTDQVFMEYMGALNAAQTTGNWQQADDALEKFSMLQLSKGGNVIPSQAKINAELWLNSLNVFGRLRNFYALLSVAMLGLFFYSVFQPKFNRPKATHIAWIVLAAAFVFHTLGLGLRWYVSGRAPWSNGYESMIYIGWTTTLAGLLFSRKSLGGMAATVVLAATILLVASMSWLDPEITPLVPVLKSYWLTIHVSLEAGSYGFLMLGAVIGMLNLILISLTKSSNKENINRTLRELTIISEITLLGGLFMVSIGTYLGGVWANESWGRYWGWDAKETWALVTILVYAFILHMRFIPGLQSVFAFNFASLFGFATVIMTYFGVNYYLSGLHSYAAGDPVPIPSSVYYTTIVLTLLSIVSYMNYRRQFRET